MVTSPLPRNLEISSLPAIADLKLPKTKLFGTDGIRGRAGDFLTEALAWRVGFCAGEMWRDRAENTGPVLVGRDSRNSSEPLARALADGLNAAGLNAWQLGLCPTPAVAQLARHCGATGGIMVSASHNPPADNGIKFFDGNGIKLSEALQERLETAVRAKTRTRAVFPSGIERDRSNLLDRYVASLCESLGGQRLDGLHVVLDLAWGSAVSVAAAAFEGAGARVTCLHDRADGDRINVRCGSTHLEVLKEAVLAYKADMGFAFDGDADRVLAVDNRGRAIDGDYILYLWGRHLQRQGKLPNNAIVATVMSNLGFEKAWQRLGGTLLRAKVGDRHVCEEMRRSGAVLGGEQSGHILCTHYGITGDGTLTALHLAALVRRSGVSLAELVADSFQTYPQLLRNVRVEDREKRANWQACSELQAVIQRAEEDLGDRGRILVRASGTEPVIRVMVEAETNELVYHWTDVLAETVERFLGR